MIIKPFQTDFSRFFDRAGPLPIPNNMSLIVDEHVIECNGPILAQHSLVLFDKLTKSNEVFLDEFSGMVEGVLDCIEILYGKDVAVSLENLQALMKFSLLFKVERLYDLCLEWVRNNARAEILCELFKVGAVIYTLNKEYADTLEVCRDVIICSEEPDLMVQTIGEAVASEEEDQSNLMMFFLEKNLLKLTLQIVTDWVDCNDKVVKVLDKIEEGQLYEVLSEEVVRIDGVSFISKLCETAADYETVRRASVLQSRLMKTTCTKYFQHLQDKSLVSFLQRRQWKKFLVKPLIDHLSLLTTNQAVCAEVLMSTSNQSYIDALWPTLKPWILGNQYCENLVREAKESKFSVPIDAIQYQANTVKGYYKEIPNAQAQLLKQGEAITGLFDCQVQGCTEATQHSVTFLLSEDKFPHYNLNVPQIQLDDSHVHLDCVQHWYLCNDMSRYPGRRLRFVSLATVPWKEIIADLGDRKGKTFVGCIMNKADVRKPLRNFLIS